MSLAVARWLWYDPATDESYRVEFNPNKMSDPTARVRNLAFAKYDRDAYHRYRSFETPAPMVEWTFSGVIQSQEHHDALLEWCKKTNPLHITDHLNRTWEVMVKSFVPVERKPTKLKPWRFTYTIGANVLRQVS